MIHKVIVTGFLITLLVAPSVFAHEGHSHDDVTTQVSPSAPTSEVDNQTGDSETAEGTSLYKQRLEARRAELRQRLSDNSTQHRSKLEGRLLERCQKRQDTINNLIDKSATIGKKRLAHIQHIEDVVKKFYEKKQLSSDEYAAALVVVDEKEAAAVAALDVIAEREFDCTNLNAKNPSGEIKLAHQEKRQALNAYRKSVKDLIKVVKTAFANSQQSQKETEQ